MDTTEFTILERYEFLRTYIDIITSGQMSSLIITGTTGVGKSWTVKDRLKDIDRNVFYVKGFSTARALYDALYRNRNNIIVFDDCDSIMEDKIAVNILKGALDSYDERVISWLSKSNDKSIPLQFNFQGQVIFISNLEMSKMDKAMKSRALTIDLTMTFEEKKDLMYDLLESIQPEVDYYDKLSAIKSLIKHAKNEEIVNLRTLEQAILFTTTTENYDKQIQFMLSS